MDNTTYKDQFIVRTFVPTNTQEIEDYLNGLLSEYEVRHIFMKQISDFQMLAVIRVSKRAGNWKIKETSSTGAE